MRNNFILLSPWTWTTGEWTNIILLTVALSSFLWRPSSSATECTKKKYYVNIFGVPLNATVQCPMTFQWTVSEYCCYGKYDRYDSDPFCCYSDTYKLVLAVGIICLLLLGSSCVIFICWAYNLPHHILYLLSFGHFNLNNWTRRNMINGPYVDPSFYSGEPFWSRGGSEIQPYPLRPMPPRIFYPAAPANIKFRWDSMAASGQMPLFIVASRQFTRNPYSARPSERTVSSILSTGPDSRRSSLSTLHESNHNKLLPLLDFHINIDEMEAAAELLEALKRIEDKGDKSLGISAIPPDIPEEESLPYGENGVLELDENAEKPDRSSFVERELETVAEELLKDIEDEFTGDPEPVTITIGDDKIDKDKIQRSNSTAAEVDSTNVNGLAQTNNDQDSTSTQNTNVTLDSDEFSSLKTRPSTSYSVGDDVMPKEVQRLDIPYTCPKLPGTIPENTD